MEAGIVANSMDLTLSDAQIVDVPTAEVTIEPRKQRERRQKSPNTTSMLLALEDPVIASTSGTSAQVANDTTFEPTIDMMVNDFDDEQTLNEEEALAASEQQDPQDEIATLREESEMPLEQLLAKYQSMLGSPLPPPPPRKKRKQNKRAKSNKNKFITTNAEGNIVESPETVDTTAINDEDADLTDTNTETTCETKSNGEISEMEDTKQTQIEATTKRSYLLDLYPDQNFETTIKTNNQNDLPLEALYCVDEIESETEEEEEEEIEPDADYVKKTIMVGSAYQASIPIGLSQYGDVLPYENEDKLIWEPSQVSEREVEEYLLMARDIKPSLCEDEQANETIDGNKTTATTTTTTSATTIGTTTINTITTTTNSQQLSIPLTTTTNATTTITSSSISISQGEDDIFPKALNGFVDYDTGSVVKDNEQALHLLVQCGYDFKEALRRKRLNAVPLTGSMSIWSEEECEKFEEGIQKFGKDFLRIRQNQVRTRSMRELVLFYYLWKKSERRDNEFANADTVDHMDIYLNESGDYSAANNTVGPQTPSPTINVRGRSNSAGSSSNNVQKNISIMAVSQPNHAVVLANALKSGNNRKRNSQGNSVHQLLAPTAVTTANTTTTAADYVGQ